MNEVENYYSYLGEIFAVVDAAFAASGENLSYSNFENIAQRPFSGFTLLLERFDQTVVPSGYYGLMLSDILQNIELDKLKKAPRMSNKNRCEFWQGYYFKKYDLSQDITTSADVQKTLDISRQRIFQLLKDRSIIAGYHTGIYVPSIVHYKNKRGDRRGGRYPKARQ